MTLVEFDTNFELYTRNDEILIFVPSYDLPFNFISMSTEDCKIRRKTSWCNLKSDIDGGYLEIATECYKKSIDFYFKSHVYFYQKSVGYRLSIQIPNVLQSLKSSENLFYSIYVGNSGQMMTKITRHVLGTNKQRLISIADNEIFQQFSMDEKKNLLALFLSKSVDNFNLALNILNLL